MCVITLKNAQHVVLPRNDVVVAVMCVCVDRQVSTNNLTVRYRRSGEVQQASNVHNNSKHYVQFQIRSFITVASVVPFI